MQGYEKIGYTYKKSISAYQAIDQTKRKQSQINVNKKKKKLFIYESRVNNSSKDSYVYSKKGQCCILKRKSRATNNSSWHSKRI